MEEYFIYCKECKTRECEYSGVHYVMEQINERNTYEFAGCPDKEAGKSELYEKAQELLYRLRGEQRSYVVDNNEFKCTADLRFMNNDNQELYIEVKRILLGYENSDAIGKDRGMQRIQEVVLVVLENLHNTIRNIIANEYSISIPVAYINEFEDNEKIEDSDAYKLYHGLNEYISKYISYGLSSYTFERENGEKFDIIFKKDLKDILRKLKIRNSKYISNKQEVTYSDNKHISLADVALKDYIIKSSDFYFIYPATIVEKKDLSLDKYFGNILNGKDLINQIIKNMKKAVNSFYDVNGEKVLILEVNWRTGSNELLGNDKLIEIFCNNLVNLIKNNYGKIKEYDKYYDSCYLVFFLEEYSISYKFL